MELCSIIGAIIFVVALRRSRCHLRWPGCDADEPHLQVLEPSKEALKRGWQLLCLRREALLVRAEMRDTLRPRFVRAAPPSSAPDPTERG